jgi:hypothetical protein
MARQNIVASTWSALLRCPRFFGRFNTEAEAEKWIAEHHWLTEQHPEPDLPHADDPEAPNDR